MSAMSSQSFDLFGSADKALRASGVVIDQEVSVDLFLKVPVEFV